MRKAVHEIKTAKKFYHFYRNESTMKNSKWERILCQIRFSEKLGESFLQWVSLISSLSSPKLQQLKISLLLWKVSNTWRETKRNQLKHVTIEISFECPSLAVIECTKFFVKNQRVARNIIIFFSIKNEYKYHLLFFSKESTFHNGPTPSIPYISWSLVPETWLISLTESLIAWKHL